MTEYKSASFSLPLAAILFSYLSSSILKTAQFYLLTHALAGVCQCSTVIAVQHSAYMYAPQFLWKLKLILNCSS